YSPYETTDIESVEGRADRCGDCLHWRRVSELVEDEDGDDVERPTDFGVCERVSGDALEFHGGTLRGACPDVLRDDWRRTVGAREAVPGDGSGSPAALLTRDRFGCVRFSVRKPGGGP